MYCFYCDKKFSTHYYDSYRLMENQCYHCKVLVQYGKISTELSMDPTDYEIEYIAMVIDETMIESNFANQKSIIYFNYNAYIHYSNATIKILPKFIDLSILTKNQILEKINLIKTIM